MDKDTYMNLLYQMTKPTMDEDDKSSYFSSKHMMTNHELCGQLFGYTEYILNCCYPDTPFNIIVFPLTKNGAKVIARTHKNRGYTTNVYSVAGKNNIIKKLLDTLIKEKQDISNDLKEYDGKLGYSDVFSELTLVSTM